MPDEPLRAGSGVRLRFRTDCISGLCSIESLQHGPNYHHYSAYICSSLFMFVLFCLLLGPVRGLILKVGYVYGESPGYT